MESQSTPQIQEKTLPKETLDVSSLLNDLFTTESKDKILQILYKLSTHVTEKKVESKSLQAKVSSVVKTRFDTSMSELISQLLDLHILTYEEYLNSTLSDSFILTCCSIACGSRNKIDEHVQKIVLEKFAKIDPSHILQYCQDFQLIEAISNKELVSKINELCKEGWFVGAAECIDFFQLHREFDIPWLITNLIEQKEIKALESFIKKDDQSNQRLAIEIAIEFRDYRLASDLIKHYKKDPQDYPEVISDLQRGSIRHFAKEVDWMQLEEKFLMDKTLLIFCVENLIKKKKINEAFSIVKRHDLLSCASFPFYLKKNFKSIRRSDQLLQNHIFEFDDYVPTEELLKINEPGTFINMGDFGLDIKKDLIYIEETSTEKFSTAISEILSSKAVGLDSEFTCCVTKFDKSKLALLQIATNEKIYVFNVLKMKEKAGYEAYQNFVTDLLSNPEIIKVGHTIGMDLDMLTGNKKNATKSTVDIARIYQALYPKNKCGLAAICQDLLGKPMSKYEQMSNWGNPKLRKAQILYGGMDALITLKLFEKLKEEIEKQGKDYTEFAGVKIEKEKDSSKKEEVAE